MSQITKYGDYKGYINSIKYKNRTNEIINCFNIYKEEINKKIDSFTKKDYERLYYDKNNDGTTVHIDNKYKYTYIEPPEDIENHTNIIRCFILPSENDLQNGDNKIIINNIKIQPGINNYVTIYSINIYNEPAFLILGKRHNTYHFFYSGDSLELIWNKTENAWTCIKYNGSFSNI